MKLIYNIVKEKENINNNNNNNLSNLPSHSSSSFTLTFSSDRLQQEVISYINHNILNSPSIKNEKTLTIEENENINSVDKNSTLYYIKDSLRPVYLSHKLPNNQLTIIADRLVYDSK